MSGLISQERFCLFSSVIIPFQINLPYHVNIAYGLYIYDFKTRYFSLAFSVQHVHEFLYMYSVYLLFFAVYLFFFSSVVMLCFLLLYCVSTVHI